MGLFSRDRDDRQDAAEQALAAAQAEANRLLVRADEQVRISRDELDFARSSFGEFEAARFATALEQAQQQLAEAFHLRQLLDDAIPDSAQQRQQWTQRIAQLAHGVLATLHAHGDEFDRLRAVGQDLPAAIAHMRAQLGELAARTEAAQVIPARIEQRYDAAVVARADDTVTQARDLLELAARALEIGEQQLAAGTLASAPRTLDTARAAAVRVDTLLDSAESLEATLLDAQLELAAALGRARASLEELRSAEPALFTAAATLRASVPDAGPHPALPGAAPAISAPPGQPADPRQPSATGESATATSSDHPAAPGLAAREVASTSAWHPDVSTTMTAGGTSGSPLTALPESAWAADASAGGAPASGTQDAAVAWQVAQLQAVVAQVNPAGLSRDPFGQLAALQSATAPIEARLTVHRNAAQIAQHARAELPGLLAQGANYIRWVEDFAASRRMALDAQARTRLAEAGRYLELARQASDPTEAVTHAARSCELSTDAWNLAHADADRQAAAAQAASRQGGYPGGYPAGPGYGPGQRGDGILGSDPGRTLGAALGGLVLGGMLSGGWGFDIDDIFD